MCRRARMCVCICVWTLIIKLNYFFQTLLVSTEVFIFYCKVDTWTTTVWLILIYKNLYIFLFSFAPYRVRITKRRSRLQFNIRRNVYRSDFTRDNGRTCCVRCRCNYRKSVVLFFFFRPLDRTSVSKWKEKARSLYNRSPRENGSYARAPCAPGNHAVGNPLRRNPFYWATSIVSHPLRRSLTTQLDAGFGAARGIFV